MTITRIPNHPVLGKQDKLENVSFTFDNVKYTGVKDEPIAAALLANQVRVLRRHEASGSTRGIYCNIGHCFECRVTVNDQEGVRACLTPLEEDMMIVSGEQLPSPFKDWRKHHE